MLRQFGKNYTPKMAANRPERSQSEGDVRTSTSYDLNLQEEKEKNDFVEYIDWKSNDRAVLTKINEKIIAKKNFILRVVEPKDLPKVATLLQLKLPDEKSLVTYLHNSPDFIKEQYCDKVITVTGKRKEDEAVELKIKLDMDFTKKPPDLEKSIKLSLCKIYRIPENLRDAISISGVESGSILIAIIIAQEALGLIALSINYWQKEKTDFNTKLLQQMQKMTRVAFFSASGLASGSSIGSLFGETGIAVGGAVGWGIGFIAGSLIYESSNDEAVTEVQVSASNGRNEVPEFTVEFLNR